jgi:uncharacterized protein YndB with AHSA1/START domain
MPQLSVSTLVPVTPEQAWKLYTSPNEVIQWNFASDDWHCPSAGIDLAVGGKHQARMEAKDGSFGFDFVGVYSEVEPPSVLTLVMADGRTSRTTFIRTPQGTLIETTFDADPENPLDAQRAGWQAILDNYRKHAEHAEAGSR